MKFNIIAADTKLTDTQHISKNKKETNLLGTPPYFLGFIGE